ncbi:hypothetical protein HID58_002881 [Brassica napus]|uniref:Uncharacterized protein n=1 Tax=Brassica napus TaxID=3708 RepID=A0ABQ8ENI5_BRANA|nr:hypothetical protein HID58_002881 [Brassica napus]
MTKRCYSVYQRTVESSSELRSTRQNEKPSCIIYHRSSVDLTVKRFMRKGHLYPPVPSEEGEVHGKEGDVVEGNEYERVTVGVVYEDNSEKMAECMKKLIDMFKDIMESKRNPGEKGRCDFNHVLTEKQANAPSF